LLFMTHRPHVLETSRLRLREVLPSEARAIVAGQRPRGQAWAAGYPLDGTLVAAMMLLSAVEVGALRAGFGMYQITDVATGEIVGDIGFRGGPDETGAVEVGYGLVPARRGEGLMSESLRSLTAWALAQPGVVRLVAGTEQDNAPSQRLLLRVGFSYTGTEDGERRYELAGSPG
jgi:RimJ/RimL family protein N-acetyltransferase